MLKNIIACSLIFSASLVANAQTTPDVSMFTEVQVTVFSAEKLIYTANVIVPRGETVEVNTFENISPKSVCEPNHTFTPPNVKKGMRIALTADAFGSNRATSAYIFEFSTVSNNGTTNLNGCKWENIEEKDVKLNGTISLEKSAEIQTGESNLPNLRIKLIDTFNTVPQGKTPGVFYKSN